MESERIASDKQAERLMNRTCAGIILYNPDIDLLCQNIEAIEHQVDRVVLIDNCSTNINEILKLNDKFGFPIIRNENNKGIAYALNQLLQYAFENRYDWFLSLDQDSICDKNMIHEYEEALDKVKEDSVAVCSPYILNNNKITYEMYHKMELPQIEFISEPVGCITSAALNHTENAKLIGGFNSSLFIDLVDAEYNIRMIQNGFTIIRANKTFLIQKMGEGRENKFFLSLYNLTKRTCFKRLSITPEYSEMRLYYSARNSRYIRRKYGRNAGKRLTVWWMFLQYIYYSLTYPLKRNRIKMWSALIKGTFDYKNVQDIN